MSKSKKNVLRNEEGIALPFLAVTLPIILICTVFIFDLGRVLVVRHQLQSIADSLSLAGASATSVQPIMGTGYTVTGYEGPDHQPEIDNANAPAIVGYTPIIDPLAANGEAESALLQNEQLIDKMRQNGGKILNWSGSVEGDTKYSVTVSGEVQTIMWAKVKKIMGETGGETISLQVKSTAGIEQVP